MPSSCARPRCTTCRCRTPSRPSGVPVRASTIFRSRMTHAGIPVFNAPGANANAVKELVLAGMLMAARNIGPAWDFATGWSGDDAEIHKAVEAGKKNFVGFELPGRTLGVIGLGAIGVKVANAARALGMRVIGYDPTITVRAAWQLESEVEQAQRGRSALQFGLRDLPCAADRYDAQHDQCRSSQADEEARVLLNFARDGIIDDAAGSGRAGQRPALCLRLRFSEQPAEGSSAGITLPHLGASTAEAEENCAVMVADQVRDWLEHGNVTNSVNFPEIGLPRPRTASASRWSTATCPTWWDRSPPIWRRPGSISSTC